jgi:hypothetical protein
MGTALVLALVLAAGAWAQSSTQTPSSPSPVTPPAAQQPDPQSGAQQPADTPSAAKPAPGDAPVTGDVPAPEQKPDADKKKGGKNKKGSDEPAADENVKVDPEKVVEVGSARVNVKPGSIEDVSAVGNRDIGARGMGNWYSTDSEIKMGKMYASEIEKSTRMISDPVVTEYVNRIGQNLVKNSDCKVPFTIKIIDSDEINAMELPGGFF